MSSNGSPPPDASATKRGLVNTGTQTLNGEKTIGGGDTPLTLSSTDTTGTQPILSLVNDAGSFGHPFIDFVDSSVSQGTINGTDFVNSGNIVGLNFVPGSGKGVGFRQSNTNRGGMDSSGNFYWDTNVLFVDIANNAVGINTSVPTSGNALTVSGKADFSNIVGLGKIATGSLPAAASGNEGYIVYDDTTNTVKFSDGSSWAAVGGGSGVTSVSAVGAAPNANAATISGSVLNLEPASGSFPGVLTTGAQTIAGAKTFSAAISASNLSGTNTGDVTLAAFGSTANANGASLSGQTITLQPASSSFPGGVSTGTQTFNGTKTFSGSGTPITVESNDTVGSTPTLTVSNQSGSNGVPYINFLEAASTDVGSIVGQDNTAFGNINGLNLVAATSRGVGFRTGSTNRGGMDSSGNFYWNTNSLYVDVTNSAVGVNTSSVTSGNKLTVSGKADFSNIVGLGKIATGSLPAAAAGNEGYIVYDDTTNTVKFSDGAAWANVGSGSTGYATVQEEGSALTARGTLNFIGAGVTAVDNGGSTRTDVTIHTAGTSQEGAVSTGTQSFAGAKTFGTAGTPVTVDSNDTSGNTATLNVKNVAGTSGVPFVDFIHTGPASVGTINGTGSAGNGNIAGLNFVAASSKGIGFRTSSTNRGGMDSSGNFYWNTNTLFVDVTNSRVGIGTATPSQGQLWVQKSNAGALGGDIWVANSGTNTVGSIARVSWGSDGSTDATPNLALDSIVTNTGSSLSDAVFKIYDGSALNEKFRIRSDGGIVCNTTDDSANAGNRTVNKTTGKSAVAAAATAATITNSLVTATSMVLITPIDIDTTVTKWKAVCAAGSFTVTTDVAATAAWRFQWHVFNA